MKTEMKRKTNPDMGARRKTRVDKATREERLARVIERGRPPRDNVVPLFRDEKKPRFVAAPDDLIMYGSITLAVLSWAAVMVRIARSDGALIVTRPPDESPHDVWSFLGSRSGRLLIDGAFRTLQSFLDKR